MADTVKSGTSQSSVSEINGLDNMTPNVDFMSREDTYSWISCTKNPGHKSFIPVKEFTQDDLPPMYRYTVVEDWVKVLADLTVRNTVKYTSENRLPGDSFYRVRGRPFGRTGSGTVIKVEFSNTSDQCPCRGCEQSCQKHILEAAIVIQTAYHVVYDQSEVENTYIDLFYDDEVNSQTVRRIFGSSVIAQSKYEDICIFKCLTHDRDLADKLQERLDTFQRLNEDLGEQFKDCKIKLAVMASHPHGCYKHVTVGECKMAEHTKLTTTTARFRLSSCVVDCDKGVLTFFRDPSAAVSVEHIFKESQPTGIEVSVHLPDGSSYSRTIWQLDSPAGETKKSLLYAGGIDTPPETLDMFMDLPDGEQQIFQDDMDLGYYWDDLTLAVRVYFKEKV